MQVYTIGHYIRTQAEFLALLLQHRIQLLVDVRSSPTSRKSPHFNQDQLWRWLVKSRIRYRHIASIGGHRYLPMLDSPNQGWENHSFEYYANYALTSAWKSGFHELFLLAQQYRTAYMCGEPHPSNCHRTIISDHMLLAGFQVMHILDDGLQPHVLGQWGARPVFCGDHLEYPAEVVQLSFHF